MLFIFFIAYIMPFDTYKLSLNSLTHFIKSYIFKNISLDIDVKYNPIFDILDIDKLKREQDELNYWDKCCTVNYLNDLLQLKDDEIKQLKHRLEIAERVVHSYQLEDEFNRCVERPEVKISYPLQYGYCAIPELETYEEVSNHSIDYYDFDNFTVIYDGEEFGIVPSIKDDTIDIDIELSVSKNIHKIKKERITTNKTKVSVNNKVSETLPEFTLPTLIDKKIQPDYLTIEYKHVPFNTCPRIKDEHLNAIESNWTEQNIIDNSIFRNEVYAIAMALSYIKSNEKIEASLYKVKRSNYELRVIAKKGNYEVRIKFPYCRGGTFDLNFDYMILKESDYQNCWSWPVLEDSHRVKTYNELNCDLTEIDKLRIVVSLETIEGELNVEYPTLTDWRYTSLSRFRLIAKASGKTIVIYYTVKDEMFDEFKYIVY